MALTPGTRLGAYEIVSQIGVGGMGEVWRATDTNLDRQVAIKVLPEAVASDPERLARFDREAKTLAALNHPNIAAIYGLERADGQTALVMELVEGATLADRIAQGAVPVSQALPIAKQIAEALESAHERGIIHRDLKPANVKVRPDGTVKVLDFGLAKAMESGGPEGPHYGSSASMSPTITTPAMTAAGMILGTAAYMSPEQAKGCPADRRSDVWAFGAVLYEMLTGKRAFAADDAADTLAAVLRADVDWSLVPADVSPVVRRFLERCLEKDPRQRLGDVRDLRLALDGAFDMSPVAAAAAVPLSQWRRALPIAAALLVGAGITALVVPANSPVGAPEVVRTVIELPGISLASRDPVMAMSPDGSTLVSAAPGGLFRRELNQLTASPIAGAEGGSQPFFSPDGLWLGFVDRAGNVKKISLAGGPPVTILSLPPGDIIGGPSWTSDGQILFGRLFGGLYEVSANGGAAEPITTLGADDGIHLSPRPLPGGRAALFTIFGREGSYRVAAVTLQTGEYHDIVEGSSPGYLPTGHPVFAKDGSVWAAPFDVERLQLTGEPVNVLDDLHSQLTVGYFTIGGPEGSLVYARRTDVKTELRWIDRRGATLDVVGTVDGLIRTFDLDEDEKLLAFEAGVSSGLRVYDTERGVITQLAGFGADPNWSPDHRHVAYAEGFLGKVSTIASGGGPPSLLFQQQDHLVWLGDWSRAGDRLAAHIQGSPSQGVVLSTRGDSEPVVFDEADNLDEAEFSPDGRWIAYNADRGSGQEIFVVPFPPTGDRIQVSSRGGVQAQWRSDGKELFYLSLDGALMAVPIETTTGFRPGAPAPLFQTGLNVDTQIEQYVAAGDGSRFLVPTPIGVSAQASLVLVQNWLEELKRLVPVD